MDYLALYGCSYPRVLGRGECSFVFLVLLFLFQESWVASLSTVFCVFPIYMIRPSKNLLDDTLLDV